MPAPGTQLIATLVASFVLACALGYVARRLKLPPLVGYMVAGVLISPMTLGFFIAADVQLASQLAEIGVILLMFGVGLHFSFRDILSVWSIAIPGAGIQIVFSLALGALLGYLWGWSMGAGLLLGLTLSVASTIVTTRLLEEWKALNSQEGKVSVGWLVAQDLAMIVALVILPPLASFQQNFDPTATLLITLGKVILFIALILLVGQRAIPWLLKKVANTGSRELFTLSVLACAIGIAYGSAMLFDVSLALGAFFAGVVLSESDLSYQAASDSLPLQEAFAVLFFVSVGMLFDPMILAEHPFRILAVLAIVIIGKSIPAFLLIVFRGYSIHSALFITAGLAQVGEFSFIMATLGVSLGVLPQDGRNLILAASLLSIALSPLVLTRAEKVAFWLTTHPRFGLQKRLSSSTGRLSEYLAASKKGRLSGHAIVVGHGRVGSTIVKALQQISFPFIVIERERKLVEALRKEGANVIWGDAAAPQILEVAGVKNADILILALPSSMSTRRMIDISRELNPGIKIIARAHTDKELDEMEKLGVTMAAMGERELAMTMARHTLQQCGISEVNARLMMEEFRLRAQSDHAMAKNQATTL